jgi:hypothetical protein
MSNFCFVSALFILICYYNYYKMLPQQGKLAKINQLYRDANKICYEVEGNINDIYTGNPI